MSYPDKSKFLSSILFVYERITDEYKKIIEELIKKNEDIAAKYIENVKINEGITKYNTTLHWITLIIVIIIALFAVTYIIYQYMYNSTNEHMTELPMRKNKNMYENITTVNKNENETLQTNTVKQNNMNDNVLSKNKNVNNIRQNTKILNTKNTKLINSSKQNNADYIGNTYTDNQQTYFNYDDSIKDDDALNFYNKQFSKF